MFSLSKIKSFIAFINPKALPIEGDNYKSQDKAIFVGGCGRSGTTLLRIILGEHSVIFSGPELNVHANLLNNASSRLSIFPKKSYLLYDDSVLEDMSLKFKIEVSLIKAIRDRSSCLAEFVSLLMNSVLKKTGKSIWLEKTPKNVTILPFIFKYFPEAKFIHIIRDGRDVACSLRNHPAWTIKNGQKIPTGINKPILKCINRWIKDVSSGLKFRGHKNYFEVCYEDLIKNPEKVIKDICNFLNVPFENKMLEYYLNNQERDTKHFLPSANAVSKIDESKIGRWQKDLSLEEAEIVESSSGKLLESLGYTDGSGWLSFYKKTK